MNRSRVLSTFILAFVLATGVARASWYDDYEDGIAAARAGNWSTVIAKMTAAINASPKENNRARTYGAIFINYHPYYYRGVAYLNTGKYEQAIADFERTTGAGELDLGSIETLIGRAKQRLAAASAPAPTSEPVAPKPEPSRPVVTQPPVQAAPAVPQIDPALRQRASAAISSAKQRLTAAQQRKATGSQQYSAAMSMFTDATTRNASARSNEDYQNIISIAENAADLADLATAPAVAVTTPAPSPASPVIPKSTAATDVVLADTQRQLRRALENYFAGEFEAATRDFQALTQKLPNNGWLWAFLGASQYSQYAFEADVSYKRAAEDAFRKAKRYGRFGNGLPSQYFSRRIRRAFSETAG